jgi:hypothetical protein
MLLSPLYLKEFDLVIDSCVLEAKHSPFRKNELICRVALFLGENKP